MKRAIIYIGLVFALNAFAFGQKQTTEGGSTTVLDSGTKIDGQLQSTLDVRKAKVGDQVILKTTKTIKQDGRTVVAKGSKLIGRVTDVQEKSKSNGESRLGLLFDQIESSQLTAPISASIVSITNASVNSTAGNMTDADVFGSSSTTAKQSSSASGGGLLGGVTNTVGGTLNSTVQTVGGVTNAATQTVSSSTAGLRQTINGIQISNAADGTAQSGTTLSAAGKNIKLEKGAMIQLQLNSSATAQ